MKDIVYLMKRTILAVAMAAAMLLALPAPAVMPPPISYQAYVEFNGAPAIQGLSPCEYAKRLAVVRDQRHLHILGNGHRGVGLGDLEGAFLFVDLFHYHHHLRTARFTISFPWTAAKDLAKQLQRLNHNASQIHRR